MVQHITDDKIKKKIISGLKEKKLMERMKLKEN